jgi:hypothetical protein
MTYYVISLTHSIKNVLFHCNIIVTFDPKMNGMSKRIGHDLLQYKLIMKQNAQNNFSCY